MSELRKTRATFQGFRSPNYTMVPDELFDELLVDLSGAELKVLLYIIRRTFGFKKEKDNISLSQMLNGIRTQDGRVLDKGVGLTKKTLLAAIQALEDNAVIITERHRSADKGDEPTTYSLNIITTPRGGKITPPVGEKLHQGGGVEIPPGPWGKNYTTQYTDQQYTDQQHVDVVVSALRNFGLNKLTAEKIGTSYPEEYVLAKLEIAEWLVETHSNLVAKNPAGWLRRAIEEDYVPPRGYKTKAQRKAVEKEAEEQHTELITAEQERRQQAEEDYLKAKEQTRETLIEQFPPQPIPGTDLTTQTAWLQVLDEMKAELTRTNYQTFVKDTMLLSLDGSSALIAVPSKMHAEWLAARLDGLLDKALRSIIGRSVSLQYRVASELVGESRE